MAPFVFKTHAKVQLAKSGLVAEQIEELGEILVALHDMLQQKRFRPLDRRKAGLEQLHKLTERLLFKLEEGEDENNLVALIKTASEHERAADGHAAFNIDTFRSKAAALARFTQRASALVPVRMGRRPTIELDLRAIELIHEALRRGWKRREALGLEMPLRDAGEPSVSTRSGFWVAVNLCLKTVRHGPLTKARRMFVEAYRAREGKKGRRR